MKLMRDFDWVLLAMVLLLCLVGFMLIYSVFHLPEGDLRLPSANTYFQRQLLWFCIGLGALLIGFIVPFRYYETLAFVFYAMSIIFLIMVIFINTDAQTQRWLVLGPIQIQPSEFTKIVLLFVWARLLSGHRGSPDRVKNLMWVVALFLLPFLLVLKEPDLGTAIIMFVLMLAVLYWRGFKVLHIFFVLSPIITAILIIYGEQVIKSSWPFGIYIVLIIIIAYLRRSVLFESVSLLLANLGIGIALPMVWDKLKPYQQARILNFLDPGADKLGAGWQVLQSKIAIGSGGIAGKGYLAGTQKALAFIPAQHTDFIFSVLGEEIGFIGALLVLTLFGVLIYRAVSIAAKCKSEFASTVCIGIAVYFFFQVFVNIGMTTGIAPVTGLPLPFLSYGGSSMVVSMFMVGILLNCSARWYEY